MLNKFMQWAVPKLEARLLKKGKFIKIYGSRAEDREDVYLVRCFVLRTKYLSIYIHRFLRSDIDDPHDHPFSFLGYIVKGGYTEGRWLRNPNHTGFDMKWEERKPGSFAWRPAKSIHVVKLSQHYGLENAEDAPLTVIIRGPMEREWGFWKRHDTLVPIWEVWHKYLGVDISDKRE